ncbi:alpha/beta hydrolase [Occultella kanbiaonis]|uniref:alpha/beta hydrolase n=1 Tax=Occultella kanbiaonis TaxID=2675754 RepID=UPI0012B88AF2|nr:alpha/beta hydrolase [Occultella kanbiaonis]
MRRLPLAARRAAAWAADYAYAVGRIAHSLVTREPRWARTPRRGAGVPVVLVPGVYESWRFLEPLAGRLHDAGHPVHVVRELGLNHADVRTGADVVARHLARLALPGVVLVAHSKGGLIGKQVMLDGVATVGVPGAPRVLGMVAVNTPFAGSSYARYLPVAAVRALSPAGVRSLGRQRAVDAAITSVHASWDPHIPGGSELPGARNVRVPVSGHFRILGDPRVQDTIVAAVADYAT